MRRSVARQARRVLLRALRRKTADSVRTLVGVRFLGIDLAWGEGRAGRPANETGVAAIDATGTVLDAGWTRGVEETLAWTERLALDIDDIALFIDAPLVVTNPTGQRLCDTQVGQRYGRWKVSANTINLSSARLAGVVLRERLERDGWTYDDGRGGPAGTGRRMSECYPYTTIVGVEALGYDLARPTYKRKPRAMTMADFRPVRAEACDELIERMASLTNADPPLDLISHPVSATLVQESSPVNDRAYKHREDLLDALLCAWTASYWNRHGFERCQVLGVPPEGVTAGGPVGTMVAPARPEQRRT